MARRTASPPLYGEARSRILGELRVDSIAQGITKVRALLAVARAADSLWRADPARGAHFERLRRAIVALERASGREP